LLPGSISRSSSKAVLCKANFQSANLAGAALRIAALRIANLQGANLQDTNLRDAKVTDEQLADVRSLQGVTMPDGQKHEDWLKDKEGGGQDVEHE
jgi:uncharacterized protein YjbI with pentapeptide repeats